MCGLILAFAGALALAGSAQAAPLGPTSIRAANVVTVQGWPNWQGGWQGEPGWGQEHERREHCLRLRHQEHEIRERISYAPPGSEQRRAQGDNSLSISLARPDRNHSVPPLQSEHRHQLGKSL